MTTTTYQFTVRDFLMRDMSTDTHSLLAAVDLAEFAYMLDPGATAQIRAGIPVSADDARRHEALVQLARARRDWSPDAANGQPIARGDYGRILDRLTAGWTAAHHDDRDRMWATVCQLVDQLDDLEVGDWQTALHQRGEKPCETSRVACQVEDGNQLVDLAAKLVAGWRVAS